MHNHAAEAAETHGFDDARDAFVLRRHGDVAEGEELKICYSGSLPNARLLLLYGFAAPLSSTRHGARELFAGLARAAPHYEEKRAALGALGLGDHADGAAAFSLSPTDPLPASLLATLRARRATLAELETLVTAKGQGVLSEANERAALGDLVGACDAMLAEYRGDDAADAAALGDPATPPRARPARLVRIPERRALVACRDAAKARLM